jgi:UDP-glucose 4-epimerase
MADVISSTKFIATQESVDKTSVWNIASGTGITVSEVVNIAAMEYEKLLTDVKYSFSFSNSLRKFDPSILLADVSKLVRIGFTPRINPYMGLAEYYRLRK